MIPAGKLKKFIQDIDVYLGAVIFIAIMCLLFVQVISRYVFQYSLTWTQELSVILFIMMTYLGISSAVTYRKHLRIDALLDAVPYKVKKILLILSDIIFICFNTYILFPFINIIKSLGDSKSPILGIPQVIGYAFIPLTLTISSVKLVLDIVKLAHEQESEIGASKAAIDFDALEQDRAGGAQ